MNDRPILFSSEMVRAILEGRKTQTRRVAPIRELNILQHSGDMITWSVSFLKAVKGVLSEHSGGKFSDIMARRIIAQRFNPYGKHNDTLWVRETWAPLPGIVVLNVAFYRADTKAAPDDVRWRPSIHMPRWAGRITLRITEVRVERLHDITEDDAKAEGVKPLDYAAHHVAAGCGARIAFEQLWDTINGPGAWEANPWVWVVAFERVEP